MQTFVSTRSNTDNTVGSAVSGVGNSPVATSVRLGSRRQDWTAMLDHRLLSREEELPLTRAMRDGETEQERSRAKNKLVEHNLRLVQGEARRYSSVGTTSGDMADVFQAGVVGLLLAADKFDPERGMRFSTYATFWIRKHLSEYVRASRFVRLPQHVFDLDARVRKAEQEDDLAGQSGKAVADAFATAEMNADTARQAVSAARSTFHVASFDAPVFSDGHRQIGEQASIVSVGGEDNEDEVEAVTESIEREQNLSAMHAAVKKLPDDLRLVLEARYRLGEHTSAIKTSESLRTLAKCSEMLGISHETVRKREQKALARIRSIILGEARMAAANTRARNTGAVAAMSAPALVVVEDEFLAVENGLHVVSFGGEEDTLVLADIA